MSWALQALVASRRTGSPTRRLVLISMASRANDDGTGVFASLPVIAAWCELDARSVRRIVRDLETDGLISIAGQRRVRNGFVNDWTLSVEAIKALPSIQDELELRRQGTPDTVSGVVVPAKAAATTFSADPGHNVRPDTVSPRTESPVTPDTVSAEPIQEYNTPLSSPPSGAQTSPRKRVATEPRGSRLEADWRPSEHLRAQCRALGLEDWQVSSILEEFHDYWRARPGAGGRKSDWDATFRNRCRQYAGDQRMLRGLRKPSAVADDAAVWAKRVERWRANRDLWNPDQWGPEPDQPGYRGPKAEADLFQAGGAR